MSEAIIPGFVRRAGPEISVEAFKQNVKEYLLTGFNTSANNAILLAKELGPFASNGNVKEQISSGAAQLSKSSLPGASEVAGKIRAATMAPV